jgi:signal peptidase I
MDFMHVRGSAVIQRLCHISTVRIGARLIFCRQLKIDDGVSGGIMLKRTKRPLKKQATKHRESPIEFVSSMATVVAVALFIITFNIQAFEIPTTSMENTLLVGDHVFVDRITVAPDSKWDSVEHHRVIQHGDIIVFYSVETPDLHLVKRVIGVPGDRIHLRNGVVYRNGEP